MVGSLRRPRSQSADRRGRSLQPDGAGRGGTGARSAGVHRGGALGTVPRDQSQCHGAAQLARRQHHDARRPHDGGRLQQLQHRARPLVGDRPLGPDPPRRRGERGLGAGERRRPRGGAAFDAGAARAGLPHAARGGRRDRAPARHRRRLRALADADAQPVRRRHRRSRRRRAGRSAARLDTRAGAGRDDPARAARARDRGAGRQAARRALDRAEAARRRISANAGRGPVRAPRAAARHRGGGAAHRERQRRDRRRAGGVLSRRCRSARSAACRAPRSEAC